MEDGGVVEYDMGIRLASYSQAREWSVTICAISIQWAAR